MAGSSVGGGSRIPGASISAAATAIGSVEPRFPTPERVSLSLPPPIVLSIHFLNLGLEPTEFFLLICLDHCLHLVNKKRTLLMLRGRWGGCFAGFSCFGSQKGGKRIVPASRIPEGSATASRGNGAQSSGHSNQNTALNLSLLAPPSSPTSFTNSALPSTTQSPSCFLSISANSPGGPSSTMFATGPYAHETQLVSPPVFSTYTTEPSTAPLTPPPELAHQTTPSSPDVPFARFLSSSLDLKSAGKENGLPYLSSSYAVGGDLQATYLLYPGSPSSSLISPASATPRTGLSSPFPEQENGTLWYPPVAVRGHSYSRNGSAKLFGLEAAPSAKLLPQFHLDQAQQSFSSFSGGRLSISREADGHINGGNRHSKSVKQDAEEIEAYRASFGFSADEIIATQNYVGLSEAVDESFTMAPFPENRVCSEHCPLTEFAKAGQKMESLLTKALDHGSSKQESSQLTNSLDCRAPGDPKPSEHICQLVDGRPTLESEPMTCTKRKVFERQASKRVRPGQSCSDAEIDYRRARSLREANGILTWRNSIP